jgi:hypothetical protein
MGGSIMASIINASTSGAGGVITTADASGVLELQSDGTTVATLRTSGVNAGIQVAANAAPAFSAWASNSSPTSLTSNVATKVLFDTEEYDTNANFASSRFTPTVAGYYAISTCITLSVTTATCQIFLFKNGQKYKKMANSSSSLVSSISGSSQVYCNGTSDYIEIYALQTAATQNTFTADNSETWFQAAMVRSA